ncbi:cilia- and flagella-associated protein 90-like [Sycon ciliatum]|uniref:cilia- and flagella-associated protein 90-like n=1 Tax=Sycon ciliatum TaxID=27933 RepID=UPI0020AC4866
MAEYPGAEYKMSSYGSKHYTPGQKKEQWTQACEREEKVRKLHKATEKQADREADRHRQLQETGKLPTEKEMNVFNSDAKVGTGHLYDKLFNAESGYNAKLKRDDRCFDTNKLDRSTDERDKGVPTLSSSTYGRGEPLELPSRDHVRVQIMKHSFYRARDTNLGD